MPCEFRLRTWLPAMPAYTEWISQPAISSASSIARWIDCTVDSMLTTTPFFRPRDGCEPMPIDLDRAVGVHLADDRDDLRRADVEADDQVAVGFLLAIWRRCNLASGDRQSGRRVASRREPVRVAHVDVA